MFFITHLLLFALLDFLFFLGVLAIFYLLSLLQIDLLEMNPLNTFQYKNIMSYLLLYGLFSSLFYLPFSIYFTKKKLSIQTIALCTSDPVLKNLVDTVSKLAKKAGLSYLPQIGVYREGHINSIVIGPFPRWTLFAVSSQALRRMNQEEIEGMIAQSLVSIASGDTAILTWLSGLLAAFTAFFFPFNLFSFIEEERKVTYTSFPLLTLLQKCHLFFTYLFFTPALMVLYDYRRRSQLKIDSAAAQLFGATSILNGLEGSERYTPLQNRKKVFLPFFKTHADIRYRKQLLQEKKV